MKKSKKKIAPNEKTSLSGSPARRRKGEISDFPLQIGFSAETTGSDPKNPPMAERAGLGTDAMRRGRLWPAAGRDLSRRRSRRRRSKNVFGPVIAKYSEAGRPSAASAAPKRPKVGDRSRK
jgi:hypothetical protein